MGLADFLIFLTIGLAVTLFALNLVGLRLPLTCGWDAFLEGLRRARAWHLAIAAATILLTLSFLDQNAVRSGFPQIVAMVVVAGLFAVAWVREFTFLMTLRDEDLPGRYDKPIWAIVLVVMAPVGLFLFRSYRLAHWPEAKPVVDAAHELA